MQASLIYVMGPSGAGKDSLLSATKTLLQGAPVAFVRRYITRPAARGEWHIPVSEERFAHLEEDGAFSLTWHSHGLFYGIPASAGLALANGITLVVNGSREALGRAFSCYPTLVPVLVDVKLDVLRTRLEGRGRESGAALEERLARASMPLPQVPGMPTPLRIDNSGSLNDAAATFAKMVRALMTRETNTLRDGGVSTGRAG